MVKLFNIKQNGNIVSFDGIGDGTECFRMAFDIHTGKNIISTTDNCVYLSEAKFKILSCLADGMELPSELIAVSF